MQDHRRPAAQANWTAVLLLLVIAGMLAWHYYPRGMPAPAPEITPRGNLAEDEKSTIEVFRQASPSVVNVTTLAVRQGSFNLDVQQIPQGAGSGFIWDDDGHIVTNYHVIQNADAARITLSDHSTWPAKVVGAFPDSDLAVLRTSAPKNRLPRLRIGTSADLLVGQKVFAIGNPFGLDQTLTTGVISALGREIDSVTRRPIKGVVQTDAAINPGNSGGPLLDSAGRLIGVNTAIYSPSGASSGIGFAIPVDEVYRIVPQLIAHGKVVRPGLGVQIAPDALTKKVNVEGVLIMGVQPGSPAQKVGLRATRRSADGGIVLGDIITAIDGQAIASVEDLFTTLAKRKVGDEVTLTIVRDEASIQIKVILDEVQ